MRVARSRDELAAFKGRLAFVPTMGALHEGHLSLVRLARTRADYVAVSIFVNPTQFAPHEDFDAYPRMIEQDLERLDDVDLVYLPRVEDLYPDGAVADIQSGAAAQGLESDFRPHFFDGVCSVVHRLFAQIKPDVAVFGEKDFQQLMVIREMVKVFGLPVEIIGAPTLRDAYGLALSSRNVYLNAEELEIARKLNVVLRSERPTPQALLDVGFDKVDYVERRWGRILAAAWIGKTRLIDNVEI